MSPHSNAYRISIRVNDDQGRGTQLNLKLRVSKHATACADSALTAQQAKLIQLEQLCQTLLERVRAISDAMPGDAQADERPPHY